jgi:hypothetical protein
MKKPALLSLLAAFQLQASATPTADIAIALDTSGSMQPLINQVRDGLWKTLNSLGDLKKDDHKAKLRLALFEYGSGVVPSEANFIQLLSPLTTDHTKLAEVLFNTKATGSAEYSGLVIQLAHQNLKWTQVQSDFRSIVIAGNETIQQGPVNPLDSAKLAFDSDVLVNTIFAGPQTNTPIHFPGGGFGTGNCRGFFCPQPPVQPTQPTPPSDPTPNPIFLEWRELAHVGGGNALNIDHTKTFPYIESPFDADIVKLTETVNDTFLPFGPNGQEEYQRMRELDRNIRSSGAGTYMDWGGYRDGNFGRQSQSSWDFVSLLIEAQEDEGKMKDFHKLVSKTPDNELPKLLKGKSFEGKVAQIQAMLFKRTTIEDSIGELKEKRRLFVEEELRNRQGDQEKTFADAFKETIVRQLEAKGFSVE